MSDDAERAYYAWRTVVLRRQSTDLDEACEALVREAWRTAYRRGQKDGFSLSASLRGAIDALEETSALLRAWELEHEAIDLVGAEDEPIQPGDYHYYNPR